MSGTERKLAERSLTESEKKSRKGGGRLDFLYARRFRAPPIAILIYFLILSRTQTLDTQPRPCADCKDSGGPEFKGGDKSNWLSFPNLHT